MAEGSTVTILLSVNMLVLLAAATVFSVLEFSSSIPQLKSMSGSWEAEDRKLHLLHDTWVYPVWMVIFAYQFIWVMYGFTTLRRRTPTILLYKQIPVMPASVYVFATIGLLCIVGWLFLFVDDSYYPLSSFCSACAFIMLGIALALSLHKLKELKLSMAVNHLEKDSVAITILVQNGLGLCVTWLLFVSIASAMSILRTSHGIPTEDVTSAVIVTLLLYTVLWTVLDMAAGRGTTRWLVSPYIGLSIIYLGTLVRNLDQIDERNFIVSIIAMLLSFALCVAKIVILLLTRTRVPSKTRSRFLDDDGERFRSWRTNPTESSRSASNPTENSRSLQWRSSGAVQRNRYEYGDASAEYYNTHFQMRRLNRFST